VKENYLGAKTMIELLKEEPPQGIHVSEMKDGDVAVIVAWEPDKYLGQVVQRYENALIRVGMEHRFGWGNINCLSPACRVRVLEKGEKLVVT
jgi:hypothetical protein